MILAKNVAFLKNEASYERESLSMLVSSLCGGMKNDLSNDDDSYFKNHPRRR